MMETKDDAPMERAKAAARTIGWHFDQLAEAAWRVKIKGVPPRGAIMLLVDVQAWRALVEHLAPGQTCGRSFVIAVVERDDFATKHTASAIDAILGGSLWFLCDEIVSMSLYPGVLLLKDNVQVFGVPARCPAS